MAASSSTENPSSVPVAENPMQYYLYPPPIAQYEDVIASPNLFMDILGKFHAAMGTKFKIPIVGGKDLDLHRLFMEVTSRGGIKKVLDEKKWREAKAWTPVPTDTWQGTKTTQTSISGIQETALKRQRTNTDEDASTKGSLESSIGLPVTGVLDGKFESGYLCTVVIGGERLQGVLYQTVQTHTPLYDIPKHGVQATMDATVVRCRRRRRKKSEIRKRDPAHPKPNRSGYNFFFAEQHARLKLLHTAKDRAISRMIGEEWNKLTESEKAVYQEKAVKDKERYKSEMANYKESFKREQVLTTSTPLQQQYFVMNTNMEINGANSHKIQENEPNSEYLDDDDSSFEGDGEETTGKVPNLETGAENSVDIECKQSLNIEDYQAGQQKSTPVPQNEPLVFENELTRIQENNLNLDKKSSDDEPMIPDINDENKRKSGDQQEQDLEMFDENGPLVTNEQRDLEIPR
ncbi:putative transcription factor & chromatin remodeling ARID-HMG family [Helianthus annuus]|nr:putative transcription factor & chromatin remodeling ARID-HMG family [Helianthus annuus]